MFGRRGLSDLPVPNTSFRQFKFNLISMSQPTRKSVIPFREDASLPQAPSLLTRILEQYERRSVAAKAISLGMLVTLVGLLLDDLTSRLDTTWLNQRLIENAIEGALFTALVWIVLSARDRRLQRRFKEVGYLNHHIRNSLTVIEMAEGHVAEASERLEMVKQASSRIRRCIEKISREEDCEINEQSPHKP